MNKKQTITNFDGFYRPGVSLILLLLLFMIIPLNMHQEYFWIGMILLVSVLGLTHFKFYQINLESKQYRKGFTVLLLKFGEWKKIPDKIEYVSIVWMKKRREFETEGGIYEESYYECNIRFFVNKRKGINILTSSSFQKNLHYAKIIASSLNLKLLDATKKPAVFIKY